MDKQPVGQLPDLASSNNDDEIMVITNDEYNQLKKEKISDFITDLQSTNTNNSLTTGSDGKLFVSKTINASDVDGVLSLDNIPQLSTNKLPKTGISADNYSYPASITVNDRGQVVSITEGSAAEAGAYLDQSQITNCILEIPQNIKYTLEDGVLTIKAGTIITVPYGTTDQSAMYPVGATFLNNNFKVVKTYFTDNKFFVQAEVQADASVSSSAAAGNRMVGLAPQSNGSYNYADTACYSGATAPTATATLAIWYDTTNNVIKETDNSGDSWNEAYWCLPLLLVERTNQEWTNVLNVFNGMGYIGNTVFVNPDVKVLITTAVNDDGSKENTEYTTDSIYLGSTTVSNIEFVIAITPASFNTRKNCYIVTYSFYSISPVPPENTEKWLNSQNGLFYILRDGVWELDPQVHLGFGTISDRVITDFQPFGTVSVADDQTVLHKWGDETIYGQKTFNQPIVSTANGVVTTGNFIVKTADGASTDAVIAINSDTGVRCGSLRFENGDGFNRAMLIAAAENETSNSIILYNSNTTAYATCPTYTANYADSSVKIVTTAYMANHWTTSKPTTSSTASKARPAVVIQNYVNGTSWYRVWSDGWIEQGGRAYVYFSSSTANDGDNVTTISFLKAFTNTNYMPVFTIERYSSEAVQRTDDSTVLIQAVTNNNMKVYCCDSGNNWYHTYIRWRACGY